MTVRERIFKGNKYYQLYDGNKFIKHIGNEAAYQKWLATNEKLDRQKAEHNGLNKTETPNMPKKLYDVIYADPPWRYDFSETDSRKIENQYSTMELRDIKRLKVPSSENAVLFLWATAPKLTEALEVMSAWGFQYKTHGIWDKEKIGMGYWFRGQHELLLVGTKGNFSPPEPQNRYGSVYRNVRTNHSAKPHEYYLIIEKMLPGMNYLEMFARNSRSGWDSWGNQCQ